MVLEVNNPPLFSVVTVTLNALPNLMRTVDSVLKQDYEGYEYIIKDGLSSDGTMSYLKGLNRKNLKSISTQDDGIYGGMNQALGHCAGKYVIFLNAGDRFIEKDILSKVAKHISSDRSPDFIYGDIVTLDVDYEYQNSHRIQVIGRPIYYCSRLSPFYLSRRMICHQAWFLKKEIYLSSKFDANYRIAADYLLLLDIILKREVSYSHLPETIIEYDRTGISSKQSHEFILEYQQIQKRMFSSLELQVYKSLYFFMALANAKVIRPFLYPFFRKKIRGIY